MNKLLLVVSIIVLLFTAGVAGAKDCSAPRPNYVSVKDLGWFEIVEEVKANEETGHDRIVFLTKTANGSSVQKTALAPARHHLRSGFVQTTRGLPKNMAHIFEVMIGKESSYQVGVDKHSAKHNYRLYLKEGPPKDRSSPHLSGLKDTYDQYTNQRLDRLNHHPGGVLAPFKAPVPRVSEF